MMAAINSAICSESQSCLLPKSVPFIIGTRESKLALAQTEIVRLFIELKHPQLSAEIYKIKTAGDKDTSMPIREMENPKALWTKDLETLLLSGKMDIIVHSLKDMPTTLPEFCQIGAILAREDPRDALVMRKCHYYKSVAELPAGSVIGTSSVRRMAQIKHTYPNLQVKDMRGNVLRRLEKLDDPDFGYDALILAAAGLIRLDLQERITQFFETPELLYAVGQGAIAVECKIDDRRSLELLQGLNDPSTAMACYAERSLMRTLEGGCSVPIGVDTKWLTKDQLRMQAVVCSADGSTRIFCDETANVNDQESAEALGKSIASKMVDMGARKLLTTIPKKEIVKET